jgi:hypothetical protein
MDKGLRLNDHGSEEIVQQGNGYEVNRYQDEHQQAWRKYEAHDKRDEAEHDNHRDDLKKRVFCVEDVNEWLCQAPKKVS